MRKEKRNLGSRLLSGVLAAVMTMSLAMSPLTALNTEAAVTSAVRGTTIETTNIDGDIQLRKTATLEDDGTYTIDLEAWAVGQVSTKPVALDMVMVNDQSGSMFYTYDKENVIFGQFTSDNLDWYPNKGMTGPQGVIVRNNAMIQGYYTNMQMDNWTLDPKVVRYVPNDGSTVGVGKGKWYAANIVNENLVISPTETQMASTAEQYQNKEHRLYKTRLGAFVDAATVFVDLVCANAQKSNLDHRITVGSFSNSSANESVGTGLYIGDTFYRYGNISKQLYADSLQNVNNTAERENIYKSIRLAKREMGLHTYTNDGLRVAQNVFANAKPEANEFRKNVVIFFADGESHNKPDTIAVANDLKEAGVTIYSVGIFENADSTSMEGDNGFMQYVSSNYPKGEQTSASEKKTGYYFTARNPLELENVFKQIAEEATDTQVTLDETAILKDIMANGFLVTSDSTVKIETIAYKGNNTWDSTASSSNTRSLTSVELKDNAVYVDGFDYSANYVAEETADHSVRGKKLHVTITGVQATKQIVTNSVVNTNNDLSGIYYADINEPVATFGQPKTELVSKSYVMDYAKPLDIAASELTQGTLLNLGKMVNSSLPATDSKTFNGVYGNAAIADNKITYSPKTTNWNGYDTFYSIGTWDGAVPEGVTTGNNVITEVSVLPATSVYYEDDFVTTSTDGTTETGTIGIKYSGNWLVNDGTAENATANAVASDGKDAVHGWEDALAGDKVYSDNSSHKAEFDSSNMATATFEFTGTGVDIYSRTDANTGLVVAKLRKKGQNVIQKYLIMDNLSESGTYYQIPTLYFDGLEYGTYTVELTVSMATDKNADGTVAKERKTYYLDGIRVYNPINTVNTNDTIVKNAYKEENLEANFKTIRSILLTQKAFATTDSAVEGAVFIDSNDDNNASGDTGILDGTVDDYECYGPKNEVYLSKNQSVAFKVNGAAKAYYIGLKSPTGSSVVAKTYRSGTDNKANASEITIEHSTDLYYEITSDEDNYIVITNTSDDILSVTKICTTGLDGNSDIAPLTQSAAVSAVYRLSRASVNQDTDDETKDDIDTPSTGGDVEIDNPSVDDGSDPADKLAQAINKLINNLFKSIRKWFGSR